MNDSALVEHIIEWENGRLDEAGVIRLFQHLVNTGKAWTLQGYYGDTAAALLREGLITPPSAVE